MQSYTWQEFESKVVTAQPTLAPKMAELYAFLQSDQEQAQKVQALRNLTQRDVTLRQVGNKLLFVWLNGNGKELALEFPAPTPKAGFDLFDDEPEPAVEPKPEALQNEPEMAFEEPDEASEGAAQAIAEESEGESDNDPEEDEDDPEDDDPAPAAAEEEIPLEGDGLFAALAASLAKKEDTALLTIARDGGMLFVTFVSKSASGADAKNDRAFAVSGTPAELEDPATGFASFVRQAREQRKTLEAARQELAEAAQAEADAIKAETAKKKAKTNKKLAKSPDKPDGTATEAKIDVKAKTEAAPPLFS